MDKLLTMAGSVMGNVISTISIILALVAGWTDMNTSIATNAAHIESQQKLIEQTATEMRELRRDLTRELNQINAQISRRAGTDNTPATRFVWRKQNDRWVRVPYDAP